MTAADTISALGASLLSGRISVIDCSGTLGPDTPLQSYPGNDQPPIEIHKISEYDADGPFFAWNWLKLGEHSGTHFDAPKAWITGRDLQNNSTDTVDPQKLAAPVCVINCTALYAADRNGALSVQDIQKWETTHGNIPNGAWVVAYSGQQYCGPDARAINYLIDKGIVGFGTDGLSTDAAEADNADPPYPAQHFLHAAGLFGLASLTNLDQLPPTGAILIAAPLRFEGGTGSPVRALALVGT